MSRKTAVKLRTGLDGARAHCTVLAADVRQCVGQFAELLGPEPRNSGIRGLPPGFDYAVALRRALARRPVQLRSEQDEQGLQALALVDAGPVLVVGVDEVSICSPFPPHLPTLGRCGAHFVGLNAHALPWTYDGRPASEVTAAHWDQQLPELRRRVALPAGAAVG